jgi:hypothetical protein
MGTFAEFRGGNFESAEKLYSEAFERNPKSVRLLCNRSLCFLKQGTKYLIFNPNVLKES